MNKVQKYLEKEKAINEYFHSEDKKVIDICVNLIEEQIELEKNLQKETKEIKELKESFELDEIEW